MESVYRQKYKEKYLRMSGPGEEVARHLKWPQRTRGGAARAGGGGRRLAGWQQGGSRPDPREEVAFSEETLAVCQFP